MADRPALPSRQQRLASGNAVPDDDEEVIRRLAEKSRLLPTAPPAPPELSEDPEPPRPAGRTSTARPRYYQRPAQTVPIQLKFPDYLAMALHKDAAARGVPLKVLVMEALEAAGYKIEDIDFRDLRRK